MSINDLLCVRNCCFGSFFLTAPTRSFLQCPQRPLLESSVIFSEQFWDFPIFNQHFPWFPSNVNTNLIYEEQQIKSGSFSDYNSSKIERFSYSRFWLTKSESHPPHVSHRLDLRLLLKQSSPEWERPQRSAAASCAHACVCVIFREMSLKRLNSNVSPWDD